MTNHKETANSLINYANNLGWAVEVRGEILTISKRFEPGNMDEFVKADGEYYGILSMLRSTRPGSMWGTSGDGVGGVAAVNSGRFVMNKSGGDKRVLKAIKGMI